MISLLQEQIINFIKAPGMFLLYTVQYGQVMGIRLNTSLMKITWFGHNRQMLWWVLFQNQH